MPKDKVRTNGTRDAGNAGAMAAGMGVLEEAEQIQAFPLATIRLMSVVPGRVGQISHVENAPMMRRLGAGLIDRLVPLPFIIPFFWPWALVVLAYDLLRDAQGASIGKRLMALRAVIVSPDPALDGQPCMAGRSLLRNLLWTSARLCYLVVVLAPVGLALDMTGCLMVCLMVCLTAEGQHLGDRIGGTRVVLARRQEGDSHANF